MAEQGPADSMRITAVEQRLQQLQALIDQQQAEIMAQRTEIAQLREEQLREEQLREGGAGAESTQPRTADARARRRLRAGGFERHSASPSSRRALLKWGGAAAAAATVALAMGEGQSAHAASSDGSALIVGQSNTSSLVTDLIVVSGALPSNGYGATPFVVDAGAAGQATTGGVFLAADLGTGLYARSPNGYGLYGESTNATGIGALTKDATNRSPAIYASNVGNGDGIDAFGSTAGSGIYAQPGPDGSTGNTGTGVSGFADAGTGVQGSSGSGYGVVAISYTGVDLQVGMPGFLFNTGQGRLAQVLQPFAGAPTTGTFSAGEQLRDSDGDLWLCLSGGSPGSWVRAAHAIYGYTGGATSYLPKPIRLLDTRGGDSLALTDGGGPYASGSTHSLQIAGVLWQSVPVPSNAVGAIGKVTAISTAAGGGYIALVPQGAGFTGTANLPFGASATVATSFNVGLSGGYLDIIIGGNATHVVIDLFAVVA